MRLQTMLQRFILVCIRGCRKERSRAELPETHVENFYFARKASVYFAAVSLPLASRA